MFAIRNLPIARKFVLAFGLVCALCVGLGVFTFATFHSFAIKNEQVSETALSSVSLLARIQLNIDATRRWDLARMLCQTETCSQSKVAQRQLSISGYGVWQRFGTKWAIC